MQPLTIFDAHFKAADTLLRVYRLLESDATDGSHDVLLPRLRELVECGADEPVILLLNDFFLGLVRERADLPPAFFRQANLALLLRQAVVSACTAMDVFFPALLDAHLPEVVRVRRRNFLPSDGEVRGFFRDFRLKLDELPGILEEDDVTLRFQGLARRVLDYCRDRTLSNVDGISTVMLMLGIAKPWEKVAAHAGMKEESLREQIKTVTKRRNDIVHRGDRPSGQPEGPPQEITYAWTSSHVSAVRAVATTCDELARRSVRELLAEAVEA